MSTTTNEQLSDIYYQPTNLWRGRKAINLLTKETKISKKKVIQWISLQALWQVFLPAPKRIDRPHFDITKTNQMHQADLLYLPPRYSLWKYIQICFMRDRCSLTV